MEISNYIAPQSITNPATGAKAATNQQVHKAAQDFESMFVTEMIRPMFDNENNPDPAFGGSNAEKIYRSMMVDQYGKQIEKKGGLGIAPQVEKELLKLQEAKGN